MRRKSMRRKSMRLKSMRRKSMRRKSMSRKYLGGMLGKTTANDPTTNGEAIIMFGMLSKQGEFFSKGFKERFFILTPKNLYYFNFNEARKDLLEIIQQEEMPRISP